MGNQHQDVFYHSEQLLRPHSWPRVHLLERSNTDISYNGKYPKWKFVVLETAVKKDDFIGEITGDIGRLEDYYLDPSSRWNELHHPEPFVFFHSHVPIYIDSRVKGTGLRYLRRSCHPNVTIRTFVTEERDFHHCFVANEDIAAGTELTTTWEIESNMLAMQQDGVEAERARATYFSRILSNFGDCACDSADCLLKIFDLRTPAKISKKAA